MPKSVHIVYTFSVVDNCFLFFCRCKTFLKISGLSVRRVVDWNGWRRPLGCGINNNKLQWTGSNGGGFKFQKEIILKESQKRWNDIYAAKIELLGMNQNYIQGQNKYIFNMRIWNTYLIIWLLSNWNYFNFFASIANIIGLYCIAIQLEYILM